MKKVSTTFLAAGLLMITGLRAQTIADGVNDLYAERTKSAKATIFFTSPKVILYRT